MSAAFEEIRLEDIPVDDIDFSDLEKEYDVVEKFSFNQYVVVTGAPVIPESKVAVLKKALTGLFSKAGEVVDMEFPIQDGKTKGFLFVECASPADSTKIIKAYNGKRLDLKHRLFLYTMKDVEKYTSETFNTEMQEPVLPEFFPSSALKSWLENGSCRDQYVVQNSDLTTIMWNTQMEDDPDALVERRSKWSTNYVRFSPKGTYLFTYHPQGVVMWGGPKFDRLRRFYHPNVRTSSVSPTEKYLVTYSSDPIVVDNEDPECPFSTKNEGHQLCIWDISTGLLLVTLPVTTSVQLQWPIVRWSYNDEYCARLSGDRLVVHDVKKKFAPIDSKALTTTGIRDFSFAPTGVKLAPFRSTDEPSVLLSYWTPETNNMSCKATIVEVPRGRVLKTVNLVQVSNVTLHWQDNSEFICFNVERHTKSKKTLFSNLEICKLTEKDIPGEKIELKDTVIEFQWEPHGKRFVAIAAHDTGDDNPAIPRNIIMFFAPEKKDPKDKTNTVKKWVEVASISDRFSNTVAWSPAGRFVTVATLVKATVRRSDFSFYDMDYTGESTINKVDNASANISNIGKSTFSSATDLEWDPSGRWLAVWSSSLKHKNENGFKIFNIAGKVIKDEPIPNFKHFAWRPRPASLLTNGEKKKIRTNLREWSAQFAEQDAMEADVATRELILRQRELLKEWNAYRASTESHFENSFGYKPFDMVDLHTPDSAFISIEEVKEEIVEQTEENVTE
ncbi:hypothetical protein TPHA_0N00250 [Tetrapisispora phaffii CBS 4417]|uniref:Eukaryotic translation initiation factor 3 subunit B n=1 Tax=Tetrapisispora phaffii (strain ATCC 24235 / CBS 4417 / NBRC 1672 / NRRL Y-8282 / UCD 70-5) TaxID=1071381 RepID=G8C0X8_TETPH|nr:hypothetical protein TPHA_0N00250 [Tetrapisispora phaffii CBS 4417]CCE65806.1 hypothetical protein TPHA_0N00250 [Tetrapisispora phaffii CBS 4417]